MDGGRVKAGAAHASYIGDTREGQLSTYPPRVEDGLEVEGSHDAQEPLMRPSTAPRPSRRRKIYIASVAASALLALAVGTIAAVHFLSGTSHGGGPSPAPSPGPRPRPPAPFVFWNGLVHNASWFTFLDVNANRSYHVNVSDATARAAGLCRGCGVTVQVDWADHYATQLFGNPALMQEMDDAVRAWNPRAHTSSGTLNECGWPDDPNGSPQFHKRTACFYEDFSKGFNSSRLQLALVKGCCAKAPLGRTEPYKFFNDSQYPSAEATEWQANVDVEEQSVQFPRSAPARRKNVLRLTSINKDNEMCSVPCQGASCELCHKMIMSSGVVQTRDIFASARYDVVAKAPASSGLVWAMWTFHYEEHIPRDCAKYACYRDGFKGSPEFPPQCPWSRCCPLECCASMNRTAPRPSHCPGWEECPCCLKDGKVPTPCCYMEYETVSCSDHVDKGLCDQYYDTDPRVKHGCAQSQPRDPQFLGNKSLASWISRVNHEIDIEIPANCMGTSVCAPTAEPCSADVPGEKTNCNFTARKDTGCVSRFHTSNLNNYIYTTNGGTGPAYSNMCVAARNSETGEPFMLAGDGNWHKYTIDWHTGNAGENGHVDFYVDDVFIGSNNVFVPTRASRLLVGSWDGGGNKVNGKKQNPSWANWPDDWGGVPGDGKFYLSHTYISEIKITPYNEDNDVVYPMTFDQPDGCKRNYAYRDSCHRHWLSDAEEDALTHIAPAMKDAAPGALYTSSCPVVEGRGQGREA